jgi:hypothetical protein
MVVGQFESEVARQGWWLAATCERLVASAGSRRGAVVLDAVLAAVAGFTGSALGTGWALHRGLVRKRRPLSREARRLMRRYPAPYSFDPIPTVHDRRRRVDGARESVYRSERASVSR